MMLRLRRYRVFVACAIFLVFLLYRVSVNSAWENEFDSQYVAAVLPIVGRKGAQGAQGEPAQSSSTHRLSTDSAELTGQEKVNIPELKSNLDLGGEAHPKAPAADIPDRKPGNVGDSYGAGREKPLHIQDSADRNEPTITLDPPIHWTKLPEHFPVEDGSVIPLPTGTPKSIPTIQYKFGPEAPEAKSKRQERMDQIKTEMKRAWDAYRRFAFGHDELVPIEKDFRDPFAGWGATLVDSLDTLWIMGLKKEFDEAYDRLNQIDFTTTPRNEIPVFETTIRYLGGFLAAYDVTGGHKGDYPLLLKKAVELAEVLMGVFDTPNRMPVLYYNWRPAFASQPKRASVRSGVAELGTLSMEFTRLAQLTGKDKYYDAVARITNALEEWQTREDDTAPLLSGIFPENIDASGCNKSATAQRSVEDASSQAQKQAKTTTPGAAQGYVPKKAADSTLGLRASTLLDPVGALKRISKRDVEPRSPPKHSPADRHWTAGYKPGSSSRGPVKEPPAANGLPSDWDCVAQNLTASSGAQNYGMGGSQDSAYEYFPKQYLLLGGLEDAYRSMHEKTVAAVKKYLLFRPMVKDDADILFSAKAKIFSNDAVLDLSERITYEYEVTHLTCFLGGMFAMGGKIFESDEDVEIGRRLTDGCVWAYSSMPAGIMAEYAQITPCPDAHACHWNETVWHLGIDPEPEWREKQMQSYHERLASWELEKPKILRAEAERQQAEEEMARRMRKVDGTDRSTEEAATKPGEPLGYSGPSNNKDGFPRRDDDVQNRQSNRNRDVDPVSGDTLALDPSTLDQKAIEEKIKTLEEEFDNPEEASLSASPPPSDSFGGMAGQVPINPVKAKAQANPNFSLPPRPYKPPTHAEYVTNRIVSDALPEGYTKIGSTGYQLR